MCLDSIVTILDSRNYSARVTTPCISNHSAVVSMTNLEEIGIGFVNYCETKEIYKRMIDLAKRLANTQLIEIECLESMPGSLEAHKWPQGFNLHHNVPKVLTLLKARLLIAYHTKFLYGKLEQYRVDDVVLDTFKSYFSGRLQVLSCNFRHGVPQGSVLGSVLLLVTVNYLSLDGKALLFADDTTICHTGSPLAGVIRDGQPTQES
ncbi:hypothetical protein J6590_012452 [Homalodisca vitripennis]|nr:hypothetical protein J6590_012452 [Homalodisca vitripennis]